MVPSSSGTPPGTRGSGLLGPVRTASVGALLLGVLTLSLATQLAHSVLALRGDLAGFGTVLVAVLMVAYYLGFLTGAVVTPRFVERVGHIRVFAALASIASVAGLLHAQLVEPLPWLVLRLVSGAAMAGLLVVAESWLNARVTNATRGRLLSLYAVALMGGVGAGPLLLNVAGIGGVGPFVLVSVLLSLALVPVVLSRHPEPELLEARPVPARRLLRAAPLGVVLAVVIGMAHAMLLGMGAVYARIAGLTVGEVSLFLTVTILGSTLSQFPLGVASDRLDRRAVIGATAVGAGVLALAAMALTGQTGVLFLAVTGSFGALSLPLYSLGIAHVNDWLSARERVKASATLVRLNGLGLALGPLVAAVGLEVVGAGGFFLVQCLLHLGVGAAAIYRIRRVPQAPGEQASVPVPVRGVLLALGPVQRGRRGGASHGRPARRPGSPGSAGSAGSLGLAGEAHIQERAMSEQSLTDDEIETTFTGVSAQADPDDADGTDADGTDADGTDADDRDAADAPTDVDGTDR